MLAELGRVGERAFEAGPRQRTRWRALGESERASAG